MRLRWPGMRHTKAALLVFGLGLTAGFVAVVGEFPRAELPSSAVMALGLVLLPVGLFADGHGIVALRWIAARLRRRKQPQRRVRTPAKPKPPGTRKKATAAKTEGSTRPPPRKRRTASPAPARRKRR